MRTRWRRWSTHPPAGKSARALQGRQFGRHRVLPQRNQRVHAQRSHLHDPARARAFETPYLGVRRGSGYAAQCARTDSIREIIYRFSLLGNFWLFFARIPADPLEATDIPLEHPKRVVLSASIKGLLEAAVDKQCIVDVMFAGIQPMSWSSSLADIIEIRAKAFAELLEHPLAEVRNLVAERLERIELTVRRERQREAEDHSRREQRFE